MDEEYWKAKNELKLTYLDQISATRNILENSLAEAGADAEAMRPKLAPHLENINRVTKVLLEDKITDPPRTMEILIKIRKVFYSQ